MKKIALLLLFLILATVPVQASDDPKNESRLEESQEEDSLGYKLLLYIPNRILDVLDIVRVRARIGPGLAVGVRATKVVQFYLGAQASIYAGLPGPRQRVIPKSPIGLESYNGLDVSLFEATSGLGVGPDYSPTEFGGGFQLAIIGIDIGFDPVELSDFIAGVFLIDFKKDDL